MARDIGIVPALMFHSVGLEKHPWVWSYISEPLQTFEAKIALLKRKGFRGVFWDELYEHMAGRRVLPHNSILLTFDDGYLDNWVHVYPILKKYGMKGTIFVSPDFVDPVSECRPNLDDVWAGKCEQDELDVAGFLSWAEMRKMERSGLIDIQSHAMTHTWYFTGPRVIGFHEPHDVAPYPWMFWNARPDRKPFYLNEDQRDFLPWGYPLLENQKSLEATRFFPDSAAIAEITNFVADLGGDKFFRRPQWSALLNDKVSTAFAGGEIPGRYESDEARSARIIDELSLSKNMIEISLEKKVQFICWPGGANNEAVRQMARNIGYRSWTLSSRSLGLKRNRPGADPASIKRIGTSNRIDVKGRPCGTGGSYFQALKVLAHQGSILHSVALRAYKLIFLIASFFRVR